MLFLHLTDSIQKLRFATIAIIILTEVNFAMGVICQQNDLYQIL